MNRDYRSCRTSIPRKRRSNYNNNNKSRLKTCSKYRQEILLVVVKTAMCQRSLKEALFYRCPSSRPFSISITENGESQKAHVQHQVFKFPTSSYVTMHFDVRLCINACSSVRIFYLRLFDITFCLTVFEKIITSWQLEKRSGKFSLSLFFVIERQNQLTKEEITMALCSPTLQQLYITDLIFVLQYFQVKI